jgi:hypothetical protein
LRRIVAALAAMMVAAPAAAQADDARRIALDGGYSIAVPAGEGWTEAREGALRSYSRVLGPQSHTLVLVTAAGPSGITREQVQAIAAADRQQGATLLTRALGGFMAIAWKRHAAGLEQDRYTVLSREDAVDSKFAGDLVCAVSRIRVRDGAPAGEAGAARILRYVAYTCVALGRLMNAAHASYSERALEPDLSPEALERGEAFARSLRSD